MREALKRTQTHTDAHGDTQTHSDALRRTQTHSDALSGTRTQSETLGDISKRIGVSGCNQTQSSAHKQAYWRAWMQSDAIRRTQTSVLACLDVVRELPLDPA